MSTTESERERLALRERLAEAVGSETAGILMEHIPPARWDELATKDDLNALAATIDAKHDLLRKEIQAELKEMRAELKEMRAEMKEMLGEMKETRGEMKEGLGSLLDRSAEQQAQFTATMTGQHRTTMLALLGVFVAVMASTLIPLLTSSPV